MTQARIQSRSIATMALQAPANAPSPAFLVYAPATPKTARVTSITTPSEIRGKGGGTSTRYSLVMSAAWMAATQAPSQLALWRALVAPPPTFFATTHARTAYATSTVRSATTEG